MGGNIVLQKSLDMTSTSGPGSRSGGSVSTTTANRWYRIRPERPRRHGGAQSFLGPGLHVIISIAAGTSSYLVPHMGVNWGSSPKIAPKSGVREGRRFP